MNQLIRAVLILVLISPGVACAQRARNQRAGNAREAVANRGEARDNRRDLRRDQFDLGAIVSIRDAWQRAVAARDRQAERQADGRLAGWLARELRDSRQDVRETQRETNRSRRERNRSRREVARSGTMDDRRDLRDDRRDLRDDRRDRNEAVVDLAQTRAITNELRGMQPAFQNGSATPQQYSRKRELLNTLVAMSVREVREDREEIREDRRERREDSRERREDRR